MIQVYGCRINIVKGDITDLKVDAIVNAANNKLVMGGGVAFAIKKKGGNDIEEEAMGKGPINVGDAVFTGGGRLAARYVIHAATMGMDFRTDEKKIRTAAANALKAADGLKVASVAFPALGCGVGGFPVLASAKIMAQEVLKYLRKKSSHLREIVFCLYDNASLGIFEKGMTGYIKHFTDELENRPYTTVDAIIEMDDAIVIIERSNPPFGWALPGGFVDYGESLEEAVVRESKEETGLDITGVKQFHTYSDPARDPRFHTIGTVFVAKALGEPKAGDDAAALKVVKLTDLKKYDFAFDHVRIIDDYLRYKKGEDPF